MDIKTPQHYSDYYSISQKDKDWIMGLNLDQHEAEKLMKSIQDKNSAAHEVKYQMWVKKIWMIAAVIFGLILLVLFG